MRFFALGSDTGGPVRIPAALCGVYGIVPSTAGSIRRAPVTARLGDRPQAMIDTSLGRAPPARLIEFDLVGAGEG